MDEKCRLCFNAILEPEISKNLLDFPSESYTEETISSLIDYFFRIIIPEKDIYTKLVCEECCERLVEIKKFQNRVLETEVKLQNELRNLNEIKSEETDAEEDKLDLCTNVEDVKKSNKKTNSNLKKKTKSNKKKCTNKTSIKTEITKKGKSSPKSETTDTKPPPRKKLFFQCEVCGKTLSTHRIFKVHMDHHKGLPPPEFPCEICGKIYNRRNSLFEHRVTHHEEPSYQCEQCGKKFKRRNQLKHHIAVVHEGVRPYPCQLCGKSFGDSGTLHNHMRSHTDARLLECSVCGKTFKYLQPIQQHIIRYHANGETDKEVLSKMINKLKSLNYSI